MRPTARSSWPSWAGIAASPEVRGAVASWSGAAARLSRILAAIALSAATACAPPAPPVAAVPADTPARFVGRAACGACHAAQLAAFTGSHHDHAMDLPAADTVLGNFNDAELKSPDLESRYSRRDGQYLIRTAGADGRVAEFPVAYTFGVAPLQQFLVAAPGGRLQAFGAAWDARPAASGGQRWFDLYPDQRLLPGDSLHWTGPGQNWNHQCAECHTTNFSKGYDAANREFRSSWSEGDVSCEACHGAGSRHLDWARSGDRGRDPDKGLALAGQGAGAWHWDAAAGKPLRSGPLPAVADVETCGRCHARRSTLIEDEQPAQHLLATHRPALLGEGLYHADGQILDEVFEYGSFLQSRMAQAGVSCSDCHEPHSLKLRAEGNALCGQCHAPARYEQPAHSHHAAGSAGSQCVNCHMPARNYMVVDSRRDHSLRIPRPDLSVKLGVPNACNACHAGQSPAWAAAAVTRWFGERRRPVHYGETLAAARAGDSAVAPALQALAGDGRQPAIVRATALVELARFPGPGLVAGIGAASTASEPLLRLAAAMVLEGLPPQLRPRAGAKLLTDSLLGVRVEAARQLAATPPGSLPALQPALAEYRASLLLHADRAEAQLALGNLQIDLGSGDRAEAAYREAITLDPTFAPAYVNLGDLQRARGAEAQVLATIRAGLGRAPDDAALRHALGLALVRQGDRAAAVTQLRAAAESAPESARYAYVLGVALNDLGHADEALAVLTAAQVRHPGDRDIRQALAAFRAAKPADAGKP